MPLQKAQSLQEVEYTKSLVMDMRIAQVAPYFYPHFGGVESHVFNLSEGLVKDGHDVTVYTSLLKGTKVDEGYEGILIKRVKPFKTIYSTPITPKLKKLILQGRHDVIHAHFPPPMTSYYASKSSKKSKTPFILTYHCDLELPKLFGSVITAIYRTTLGRSTLKNSKKIIVTTRTYAATSRDLWKFEPCVIPNAIDPKVFNPEDKGRRVKERHNLHDSKIVLYVGRLKFHKGLEYLIESAQHTTKNVKYLIVGGGDYEPKLKRLMYARGLDNRIIFAGEVPNKELPEYYAACDVFVLPSISRLEAFGIVGLEAMASGKPVIISDIPGVREVIEEGVEGLLVEPMNAEDLAEKINILLSDAALRKKMGEHGRRKVEEKFTWDKVVRQIEEVYKEVI